MFTTMNPDFGCNAQPNSVFEAMHLEFGFIMKPKCVFIIVNRDFGWAHALAASRTDPSPTYGLSLKTKLVSNSLATATPSNVAGLNRHFSAASTVDFCSAVTISALSRSSFSAE